MLRSQFRFFHAGLGKMLLRFCRCGAINLSSSFTICYGLGRVREAVLCARPGKVHRVGVRARFPKRARGTLQAAGLRNSPIAEVRFSFGSGQRVAPYAWCRYVMPSSSRVACYHPHRTCNRPLLLEEHATHSLTWNQRGIFWHNSIQLRHLRSLRRQESIEISRTADPMSALA